MFKSQFTLDVTGNARYACYSYCTMPKSFNADGTSRGAHLSVMRIRCDGPTAQFWEELSTHFGEDLPLYTNREDVLVKIRETLAKHPNASVETVERAQAAEESDENLRKFLRGMLLWDGTFPLNHTIRGMTIGLE